MKGVGNIENSLARRDVTLNRSEKVVDVAKRHELWRLRVTEAGAYDVELLPYRIHHKIVLTAVLVARAQGVCEVLVQ